MMTKKLLIERDGQKRSNISYVIRQCAGPMRATVAMRRQCQQGGNQAKPLCLISISMVPERPVPWHPMAPDPSVQMAENETILVTCLPLLHYACLVDTVKG